MDLTPQRWQEVKQVLERMLPLTPAEREAELSQVRASDAELGAEVESLLLAHEDNPDFLEESYSGIKAFGAVDEPDAWLGRVLGAYRLVEQIGQGGMGTVYRAERADGLYSRTVAVKVIRSALSTDFFLRRFANERAILARLDHPNVARLLDGGASADGVPYVVMEFVDGVPIDRYCRRAGLSIRERLELFSVVCAAVQYAHQNLIVHRDLKPGNILVSAEGQPKLVDFGIGKILDLRQELGAEQSRTALPLMTPEFASPEQLRGEPVTTASDLYSLGVVLCELLTGNRPYKAADKPAHEMLRIVCEADPARPSTVVSDALQAAEEGASGDDSPRSRRRRVKRLRQALQGDLDSIVLKALRKDPRDRYATVEQLRDDIRRHLEGLPVTARRGSTIYRVRKFARRHALGVVIAAGVAMLLLGAMIVIFREAQIANLEASRAQRRFNEVRKLAHSLLFEDHDAIQNLPGSTAARKLIIDQSLEYLDSLSREAGNDRALQQDLAEAYQRVGQLQGLAAAQNVGDPRGAIASLMKSLAIRNALAVAHPADVENELAMAKAHRTISRIRAIYLGDLPAALQDSRQALAISERLNGAGPPDTRVLRELAADHQLLSNQLGGNAQTAATGDVDASLGEIAQATALTEQLVRMQPKDTTAKRLLAVMHHNFGDELVEAGRRREAWQHYEKSDQLSGELMAADPHDVELERAEANTIDRMAEILLIDNRNDEALGYFRRASRLIEPLFVADAQDRDMRLVFADNLLGVGLSLAAAGQSEEGLVVLHRVLRLVSEDAATSEMQQGKTIAAFGRLFVGETLRRRGEFAAALAEFQQARDLLQPIATASPNDNVHGLMLAGTDNQIAALRFAFGDVEEADREYRRALALSEAVAAQHPAYLEAAYSVLTSNAGLGDVAARAAARLPRSKASARWQEACDSYSKSVSALDSIKEPATLSPGFFPVPERRELTSHLSQCQRALKEASPPDGLPRDR